MNNVEKAQDSYKSRMAQKWGIPVVSVMFIESCIESGKLLEPDQFVVAGKTPSEELSSGKIVGKTCFIHHPKIESLCFFCIYKVVLVSASIDFNYHFAVY